MKILVTGAKGFVGSYLTFDKFISFDKQDWRNILTDRLPEADVIIHLAAQTSVLKSVDDPFDDAVTNILGTIRLAKKYKNKLFIYASSGGAIQEKIESPYGMSKYCGEEYVKLLCKNYRILRFPNIYGEGSKSVVEKFINGKVVIYGDGTSTRDYVHVTDIARGIKASIDWPMGTYSLGSETNVSVQALAEATGKPIEHIPAKPGELQHSYVSNSTKGRWQPNMKVLDYIHDNVH